MIVGDGEGLVIEEIWLGKSCAHTTLTVAGCQFTGDLDASNTIRTAIASRKQWAAVVIMHFDALLVLQDTGSKLAGRIDISAGLCV